MAALVHFYSLHFYPEASFRSPNQTLVVLTRTYAMNILTSTFLTSLSLTACVNNCPKAHYTPEMLYRSDLVQQQLIAQQAKDGRDCNPRDGQSPVPGCGRTDHWPSYQV